MELLFTSDLHGSASLYEQVLAAVRRRRPDVVVLGGDLMPDGSAEDVWGEVTGYIRGPFREFLLALRAVRGDMAVLGLLGNHDWSFSTDEMVALEAEGLVRMLGCDRLVEAGGITFLGLSYSPPSPYWIKDFDRRDMKNDKGCAFDGYVWSKEKRELVAVQGREYFVEQASVEELLAASPATPVERPWVLVAHAPPAGTNLEMLFDGVRVGSQAVRRFIEVRQPTLSLHGHLHDSPKASGHVTDRIGRCVCVNPGQTDEKACWVLWDSERPGEIEHSLGWAL